jgi:hypothetical protein
MRKKKHTPAPLWDGSQPAESLDPKHEPSAAGELIRASSVSRGDAAVWSSSEGVQTWVATVVELDMLRNLRTITWVSSAGSQRKTLHSARPNPKDRSSSDSSFLYLPPGAAVFSPRANKKDR